MPAQTELQVYSVRQFEDWIENKDGSPFDALRLHYEIIHDPRKGSAKTKKEEAVEEETSIDDFVQHTDEVSDSGDDSAPKKPGRKPKN